MSSGKLVALRRGLDLALALVALGGDTGEGVGPLLLEVLVGLLLPLPGHGVRSRAGERPHGGEDDEAGEEAEGSVESDLLALAGRSLGAGTVGTESNPVGCGERWRLVGLLDW